VTPNRARLSLNYQSSENRSWLGRIAERERGLANLIQPERLCHRQPGVSDRMQLERPAYSLPSWQINTPGSLGDELEMRVEDGVIVLAPARGVRDGWDAAFEAMAAARDDEPMIVNLDPIRGSEIRKTRPCLIISPDEMNRHIRTVIIAPMTSVQRDYPTRVSVTFRKKQGQIVLDQLRAIDKSRLVRRLGALPEARAREVAGVLQALFAYQG
jgi:mRNA interferase MazF